MKDEATVAKTDIDRAIEKAVSDALEDNTFQDIVNKHVHKAFEQAAEDACRWGTVRDAFKKKVEALFVPVIESYDLDTCNVKLETLLDGLIAESAIAERKAMLERIRIVTSADSVPKQIEIGELFGRYCDFVAENYDCSGREVTDGEYDVIHVIAEFEPEPVRGYSGLFEHGKITFAPDDEDDPNDENERLTIEVRVSRYRSDKHWKIDDLRDLTMHQIAHLNTFQLDIARLAMANTALLITETQLEDEVVPEAEPEVSYA